MFKKVFIVLMACALSLCFMGCGSAAEETVEVTLPASLVENYDTSNLESMVEQEGIEAATKNEDGSITWVMTKQKHDELMKTMRESFDSSLAEMVASDDYPTFVDIQHNDNYSEFTIKVDADKLGVKESFSTLAFYMVGGFYNTFNGAPVDNVTVTFVNNNTGEVISSVNSADMGKQQAE